MSGPRLARLVRILASLTLALALLAQGVQAALIPLTTPAVASEAATSGDCGGCLSGHHDMSADACAIHCGALAVMPLIASMSVVVAAHLAPIPVTDVSRSRRDAPEPHPPKHPA